MDICSYVAREGMYGGVAVIKVMNVRAVRLMTVRTSLILCIRESSVVNQTLTPAFIY